METDENLKVEVKVLKIGLKEWLNDKTIPFHKALQQMLDDPQMHPLEQIAERDEVYQIIYTAVHEGDNGFTSTEQRVFITDLEHVMDFTLVAMITNLAGCRYERLYDYPDELKQIISKYCFGQGWYYTSPKEEYQKHRKYMN